ncbi:MAG: glycosyltransferase family 2 protein [Parvularculaceae bacterium]|nr:glycosyltransferase family 2 protein [Parvularculaceae bacterium]
MKPYSVSIIYRSLNEEKWLGESIAAARLQRLDNGQRPEFILVDSGSTDQTLEIAMREGVRIVHIKKSEFTFGRSLNFGCEAATGEILVFISAHCIPSHDRWLQNLIRPLCEAKAEYAYGRQVGHAVTRFSEHQVFGHFYGDLDKIPQTELYVNNANAALLRNAWAKIRFDEAATGLEDMVFAKTLMRDGGRLAYVADAPVIHIHEESLEQTKRRYYREALTLREIFPEVHFHFGDFLRCAAAGVFHDFSAALEQKRFIDEAAGIVAYRFMQYWGAWRGHNEHRILSRAQKESYYYPRPKRRRRETAAAEKSPKPSLKPIGE